MVVPFFFLFFFFFTRIIKVPNGIKFQARVLFNEGLIDRRHCGEPHLTHNIIIFILMSCSLSILPQ